MNISKDNDLNPPIAYLILAHNQPKLLKRLINKLNQPHIYFFIHIDKKSYSSFPKEIFSEYKNVKIISEFKVRWMGFNMVKSSIALLKEGIRSNIKFKYFVLLSGQDYPIKSNNYINDFFNSNTNDFISYNKIDHHSTEIKNKVKFFHNLDIPYINPRDPKKIKIFIKLYYGLYRRLFKILPQRTFYKSLDPYFGSQWFALTYGTVESVLKFIKENPGYMKFMKFTEGPDEMFFQTIILNSTCKNNVYDYNRYLNWLKERKEGELFVQEYSSLRYMDWSENVNPKPAILNLPYLPILMSCKDLFARKLDEVKSVELLNKIDSLVK